MDQRQIIEFLLAHRAELGEKLKDAPECWLFHEDVLPDAIKATIPTHKLAILLVEDVDDTWYIVE
jgi:hypothetical protein